MAYTLISSVTSHTNLLQSLETFLLAQGWTVNRSGVVNATQRELLVSTTYAGESFYFGLETTGTTDSSKILLSGATGYSASARDAQPGISRQVRMSLKSGAMSRAWVFATAQFCHLFLEVQPGYVQHCSFGCLDRLYSATTGNGTGQFIFALQDLDTAGTMVFNDSGGEYASGTYANLWSNNFDTSIAATHGISAGMHASPNAGGCVRYRGAAANFWTDNTLNFKTNCGRVLSTYYNFTQIGTSRDLSNEVITSRQGTNQPAIMPITVSVPRNPAQVPSHYPLGKIPELRLLPFAGLNDGDEFTIAADVWKVFRMPNQNNSLVPILYNWEMGFAVKKA